MTVELVRYPHSGDLLWMKQCTVGTMDKETDTLPSSDFVHRLLRARHSPIRELEFSYVIRDIPYWVSVHLVRHHVGFQPYVQSQRNDRQSKYDREKAPQDTPVTMRVTLNAEALLNLANKRLCMKASPETRAVVQEMCRLAEEVLPELKGLLVPMCEYHGGVCYEMQPCGRLTEMEVTNHYIEQIKKMYEQIEDTHSCKLCANYYNCAPDAEFDTPEYQMFAGCHGSLKDNWQWKGVDD